MAGYTLVERTIATGRLELFCLLTTPDDTEAQQRKVLLLGGSNFDLRLKRQFLDTSLPQQCCIATYEPRGIGRSQQPDGVWSMQDYARDALSLADTLGWQQFSVIGESFGGMTALHLALLAKERILRMALYSATPGGAGGHSYDIGHLTALPPDASAVQALLLQDSINEVRQIEEPQAFAALVEKRMAFEHAFAHPSVTSGGYSRLLAARRQHDVWQRLPDIDCPVLVVAGQRDRQAQPDIQKRLAGALPNGVYRDYPGGHGVAFNNPQVMADLCDAWFSAAMSHYMTGTANVCVENDTRCGQKEA